MKSPMQLRLEIIDWGVLPKPCKEERLNKWHMTKLFGWFSNGVVQIIISQCENVCAPLRKTIAVYCSLLSNK